MDHKQHRKGRYVGWVWLAWIIFALTALLSAAIIHMTGVLQVPSVHSSRSIPPGTWTVISICVGQTLGALMLAGGFTIANGIYDAVVDSHD